MNKYTITILILLLGIWLIPKVPFWKIVDYKVANDTVYYRVLLDEAKKEIGEYHRTEDKIYILEDEVNEKAKLKVYPEDVFAEKDGIWYDTELKKAHKGDLGLLQAFLPTNENIARAVVDTSVTYTIFPNSGEGYGYYLDATWATARDSASGEYANYGTYYNQVGTGIYSGPQYIIWRTWLPFDLSDLPSKTKIDVQETSLFAYTTNIKNDDNDGDDYIAVVTTTQASVSVLVKADWDTMGTGDLGNKDLSAMTTGKTEWEFNALGTSTVEDALQSTLKLGLREGHDLEDSAFVGSASDYNKTYVYSVNYTGVDYDPYLEIVYWPPINWLTGWNARQRTRMELPSNVGASNIPIIVIINSTDSGRLDSNHNWFWTATNNDIEHFQFTEESGLGELYSEIGHYNTSTKQAEMFIGKSGWNAIFDSDKWATGLDDEWLYDFYLYADTTATTSYNTTTLAGYTEVWDSFDGAYNFNNSDDNSASTTVNSLNCVFASCTYSDNELGMTSTTLDMTVGGGGGWECALDGSVGTGNQADDEGMTYFWREKLTYGDCATGDSYNLFDYNIYFDNSFPLWEGNRRIQATYKDTAGTNQLCMTIGGNAQSCCNKDLNDGLYHDFILSYIASTTVTSTLAVDGEICTTGFHSTSSAVEFATRGLLLNCDAVMGIGTSTKIDLYWYAPEHIQNVNIPALIPGDPSLNLFEPIAEVFHRNFSDNLINILGNYED